MSVDVTVSGGSVTVRLEPTQQTITLNPTTIDVRTGFEPIPRPDVLIFVSVQSGNWNNRTTWNTTDDLLILTPTVFTPISSDTVYLLATHTITLTKNEFVNDLWINNTEDVLRIDLANHELAMFGKERDFTGTIDTPLAAAGGGDPNTPLLYWRMGGSNGLLRIKGLGRELFEIPFVNATRRRAGRTTVIDIQSGAITCQTTYRSGSMTIQNGTLDIELSERFFFDQDGDQSGVPDADLTITSGTVFGSAFQLRKTNVIECRNFVLESGAIIRFNDDTVSGISFSTYDFSGVVDISDSSNPSQTFPQKLVLGTTPLVLPNIFNGPVNLSGGIPKLIAYDDTTFNGGLSIASDTELDLNVHNILYGTTSNLTILGGGTKIISGELPDSGSGDTICRDLIVRTNTSYDLDSMTINIRGNLILESGATVINGTLNQNQP